MKFKLLKGRHREMANRSVPGSVSKVYEQGQIVESAVDLAKKYGGDKFMRVSDDTPATGTPAHSVPSLVPPDAGPGTAPAEPPQGTAPIPTPAAPPQSSLPANLDDMTVSQLKEFAAKEEIDLEGVSLKSDIISTIRSYYA